jgi:hypothetical protein
MKQGIKEGSKEEGKMDSSSRERKKIRRKK